MPDDKSFHMTPDEFRRHGHAVVDWIADYYKQDRDPSPFSRRQSRARFAPRSRLLRPQQGEPFDAHPRATSRSSSCPASPTGNRRTSSPTFPCNASGPAILGDLLSSGLGVQGMLWATSPACTELETHVLDWLVAHARPAGKISLHRHRRRRHPGHRVQRLALRPAGRTRACHQLRQRMPRDATANSSPTARRRHIPRSRRPRRSPAWAPTTCAPSRSTRTSPCAPTLLARQIAAGPSRRPRSLLRLRHRRHHVVERHRSRPRNRPHLPRARPLAARGRRHVGHRRALPRVPPHPRRRRTRRQLLLQSAQVDVHQLRLRLSSTWPTARR